MSGDLPKVRMYTDGSCSPNPGPGGWGAVIIDADQQVRTLAGSEGETTNNRMELTAALRGLQALAGPHEVELFTDSRYLQDGITRWLSKWQQHGWTTITGEEVRNRDIWQPLAEEMVRHRLTWNWVKGHGSDEWNILADKLAGGSRQPSPLPLEDRESVHIFLAITWRQKEAAGAWAGVLQYREHYRVIGGVRREGTGNGLHIASAAAALRELKRSLPVHVYTTSGYLKEGASCWLEQWRRRDWLTSEGLEVSNRVEWQQLAALLARLPVRVHLIDKARPPCHLAAAKEMAGEFYCSAVDV